MEFDCESFAWESSDDSLWDSGVNSKWTSFMKGVTNQVSSSEKYDSKNLGPKWSSELLEDSGIEGKLPGNMADPFLWNSGLSGSSDSSQSWIVDLYRESNMEDNWTMELIQERLTLEKLTNDCGECSESLTADCDDLFSQNLLKTLGKKEGELEGFKELLNKAEGALRQSEDAVKVSLS